MTTQNIKYLNAVSTQMVIDTSKPNGSDYIGHVWHDTESAKIYGHQCWNINDGLIYLWGFPTREAATAAMIQAKNEKGE